MLDALHEARSALYSQQYELTNNIQRIQRSIDASIEAGKEASLFVTDGDVLDLKAKVTRMWIRGREIDLSSRHTRLYEKYRKRPTQK